MAHPEPAQVRDEAARPREVEVRQELQPVAANEGAVVVWGGRLAQAI
jgi:hypothetical protein